MARMNGDRRFRRDGRASGTRITAASHLIGVALLGAAVVAACSGSTPNRQFSAVLQASAEVPALPVVLSDETGQVTAIASAPVDPGGAYSELAARADPTVPSAFIVSWLGGACDNDASLTFKRHEAGYVLNVAVHPKISLGCTAVGIFRDVRIVTSSPIPLDAIVAAGNT
jgi:hypothetical protein